jgi:hypothetical protein
MKVYDLGNTQWKQLVPTTSQQANIDTVAANNTNITTVAGQISPTNNISSVASNATNIGLVGGSITNVNEVGNNMGTVNEFGERYRVSSSAPTSSLDVGDLYFDTTQNELKVYKSSGWSAAGSTINGTSARFKYTATANQTTFTGNDDSGNSLAYDAGFADVYLNGVKLVNGVDVNISSGTSVVLTSGATANDIIDIVGFGTFNVAAINAANINSGILATARGGTGLGSLGSSGQVIRVNSGGSALEFATLQGGNITTEGNFFSNYNAFTSNVTVNVANTTNNFLKGPVSVNSGVTVTMAGNGVLEII